MLKFTEVNDLINITVVLTMYLNKHMYNFNRLSKTNIYNMAKTFGLPYLYKCTYLYETHLNTINCT